MKSDEAEDCRAAWAVLVVCCRVSRATGGAESDESKGRCTVGAVYSLGFREAGDKGAVESDKAEDYQMAGAI